MRGYACLMSDFRALSYNVLVLQQTSYGHTTTADFRICVDAHTL
jgi:hypothetical protein